MDIVFIRDLRVRTVIGIYDWEREIRQDIVFDIDMASDNRAAAATDHIDQAVDYKAVSKRIVEFAEASSYQLVETLAERIAEIILNEFNVPWVRLRANKEGAVSTARDVGVIIERGSRNEA